MSDDVELPDGTYAPIQDTVCECGHWYDEHGSPATRMHREADVARHGECGAPGCGCRGFAADPAASTVSAIVDRGGDPGVWPDHAKRGVLLDAIRSRVVGEGCPVDRCDVEVTAAGEFGLVVEHLGETYRLTLGMRPREDVSEIEALASRLAETYGANPQAVGAQDGTEDEYGDLLADAAEALGFDDPDERWQAFQTAAQDATATEMLPWLLEIREALG